MVFGVVSPFNTFRITFGMRRSRHGRGQRLNYCRRAFDGFLLRVSFGVWLEIINNWRLVFGWCRAISAVFISLHSYVKHSKCSHSFSLKTFGVFAQKWIMQNVWRAFDIVHGLSKLRYFFPPIFMSFRPVETEEHKLALVCKAPKLGWEYTLRTCVCSLLSSTFLYLSRFNCTMVPCRVSLKRMRCTEDRVINNANKSGYPFDYRTIRIVFKLCVPKCEIFDNSRASW